MAALSRWMWSVSQGPLRLSDEEWNRIRNEIEDVRDMELESPLIAAERDTAMAKFWTHNNPNEPMTEAMIDVMLDAERVQ